jgi:hypothetical protein
MSGLSFFGLEPVRAQTHRPGNDSRPTGLVVGSATAPGFPVKIFIEQDQLPPMRIGRVLQSLPVEAVCG